MLIGGKSVRDYGKRELAYLVAYVPQMHAPSYDYSVFDVALVGVLCRTPLFCSFSAADKKLAEQALEKMGIAHLKNAPYTRVSGGERAYTRELLSIAASSSRLHTQTRHRFSIAATACTHLSSARFALFYMHPVLVACFFLRPLPIARSLFFTRQRLIRTEIRRAELIVRDSVILAREHAHRADTRNQQAILSDVRAI